MSVFLDFKRIGRESMIHLWRNGAVSFSVIFIMTLSLLSLSSVFFMNSILDFVTHSIEQRIDVNIYFSPDTPQEEILALKERIVQMPEVQDVKFISREEALKLFEQRYMQDELVKRSLREIGDNPLGASLNIRAKDAGKYESIISTIGEDPFVKNSSYVERINYRDHREMISRLNHFRMVLEKTVYVLFFVLLVIVIALIFYAIKMGIHSSKDTIRVKKSIGAEMRYIRGPFSFLGALYGFISGVLVVLTLFPLTYWFAKHSKEILGGIDLFHFYLKNSFFFAVIIIGAGIIIGSLSSFFAIRKYLKD